jgi:hypothetical protein
MASGQNIRKMRPSTRIKQNIGAMPETASRTQIQLARLVVILVIAFSIAGAIWYGFTTDILQRAWHDLLDRPGGPMTFRIILQPLMASVAALLDGVKDAKLGRSPYLWTVLTNPAERVGRLREGLISTARIILLGLIIDAIYQFVALKTFYPGEAVIVAIVLCFLPYLLLRGPFARITRWWRNDMRSDVSA